MPSPDKLTPLAPGGLLAERTYEALKGAVLGNSLPPGAPLSVPELARQLNVSRSPVREAVQRLIYDGLATHVPHRGAEVCRVDIDELRQLYVVRELLEGLAARLATENLDGAGLAELRDIIAEHEQVLGDAGHRRGTGVTIATHIDLDMRFHSTLRQLAANEHLTAVLDPLAGRSHFALHSLWRSDDAPLLALDEHKSILNAMAAGDAALAESAARTHIARLRVRLGRARAQDAADGQRRKPARTEAGRSS